MAYIKLDQLQPVKKRWNEVDEGDIVAVPWKAYEIIGRKVLYVAVQNPRNCDIVGYGGLVTLHFGPGTTPLGYPAPYDESKNVEITVYQ